MSINLHLVAVVVGPKTIAAVVVDSKTIECPLFQVSTGDTKQILKGQREYSTQSRAVVMERYFKWVDKFLAAELGHALDHKLVVATFLVKYPHARWYGA